MERCIDQAYSWFVISKIVWKRKYIELRKNDYIEDSLKDSIQMKNPRQKINSWIVYKELMMKRRTPRWCECRYEHESINDPRIGWVYRRLIAYDLQNTTIEVLLVHPSMEYLLIYLNKRQYIVGMKNTKIIVSSS